MNDFLSWCRHVLVPFLFHDLTSLHPPSFDFYTCKLILIDSYRCEFWMTVVW